MKQVTSIENHTQEQNCPKHGKYTAVGMLINGRFIGSQCPQCAAERKTTEQKRENDIATQQRMQKIARLIDRSGIPKRFRNRTIENYRTTCEQSRYAANLAAGYIDNFQQAMRYGTSLVFCGKPGTGKTHLAAAIANAIIEQGHDPVYLTMQTMLRMVKETWSEQSKMSEREVIRTLKGVDLLILDEVGVQFGTTAESLITFDLLNGRYEDVKPTILISNLTIDEISGYLGERLIDRITEGGGVVIPFTWESYRKRVISDPALSFPDE